MRLFHASGMRRERGFQAVTNVALRAPRRTNSAADAGRPILMSYPAAR
jgi:hypothetical protein